MDVRLTLQEPPSPTWIWLITAIVVRENGHFAIDDIVFRKDVDLDRDLRLSDLLSEGCDGPRWVGYGDQRKQQM